MSPLIISWLVAVAAASTAGKLLGTFLKSRSFGMVGDPVISILGGVAVWQACVFTGLFPATDYIPAGFVSLIAGAVTLLIASRFRTG